MALAHEAFKKGLELSLAVSPATEESIQLQSNMVLATDREP
jgi:hypothetical protein